MSYFQEWQDHLNDQSNPAATEAWFKQYYQLEKDAYAMILGAGSPVVEGTAAELADRLGFGADKVIFLGFLDGINASLKTELDLDGIADDTPVHLDIDFPQLYWHMHEAKADWLFGLKEWNQILTPDEQKTITKSYRESKIVHHEKIGRNDPCPCGSGKKYKACCGKG